MWLICGLVTWWLGLENDNAIETWGVGSGLA